MAVYKPPLGLPFVDDQYYVARPWVEWLILIQSDIVEIEQQVDSTSTATLQAAISQNEALSFYFSSL